MRVEWTMDNGQLKNLQMKPLGLVQLCPNKCPNYFQVYQCGVPVSCTILWAHVNWWEVFSGKKTQIIIIQIYTARLLRFDNPITEE